MRDDTPRIILLGDSITQGGFDAGTKGYGWALQEYYGEKAVVLNRGIGGLTARSIRPHFKNLLRDITNPKAPPTRLYSIFLGANDGCLHPYGIPLSEFATNMSAFVEDLVSQDTLPGLKIVLIATPPINVRDALQDALADLGRRDVSLGSVETAKVGRAYRTYMSKKAFADKVMELARGFREAGLEVVGVDFWTALVDSALEEEGRADEENKYDDCRLPGCGLPDAKEFSEGYFSDGLHFEHKAYEVLTQAFKETVFSRWPELQVDQI